MSIFSNDAKHSQDYTNGRRGTPPEPKKVVRKVAKKAVEKTAAATKKKVNDLKSASSSDNKCPVHGCHKPPFKGSPLCKSHHSNRNNHDL